MEELSRRALVALMVAAAGPGAGMLTLLLLAPSPAWLMALGGFDLDLVGFAVLAGVLPGAVRLGFGYLDRVPEPSPG